MTKERDIPHREAFENQGETYVRYTFFNREDDVGMAARAWLSEKQVEREEVAASKRDAREDKTLALASRANRIAWIAAAIAAISSIKEIKWIINSVISLLK
ncbi:MAG: hypothetical protein NTY00_01935 [Deltaproteobacteria bacterium]|nr:hypothetical protein [Deltaproteobacteria bacterium]